MFTLANGGMCIIYCMTRAYERIVGLQQSDVVQDDTTAVSVIEFHGDVFLIVHRIRYDGLHRGSRIQASVLLTPIRA